MSKPYTPPFALTPAMLSAVAEIAEEVERLSHVNARANALKLRRQQRARSIHASLAIENNTLTLEQVTAVISGKRVLGPPQEIHEVRNAYAAYEAMTTWNPNSVEDLLAAHQLIMDGLIKDAGKFRSRAVGIAQGQKVVHLAPPADRVAGLIKDLLGWLKRTDTHPLVAGCVVHYELEFIHPFSDGNGRMGRLWQTLILSRWNPLFALLPVESVIHQRQQAYYRVLGACDKAGKSTALIEFLLDAILAALRESTATDQVTDQVSDQVAALLKVLGPHTRSAMECMKLLKLSHRPTFRSNYLNPALAAGLIERSIPDKPNSRLQRYRKAERSRKSQV